MQEKKPRRFCILMGLPGSHIVATENSYVGSLVEMAGGQNVYAGTDEEFLSANTEDIKTKEPDVILRHPMQCPSRYSRCLPMNLKKTTSGSIFGSTKRQGVRSGFVPVRHECKFFISAGTRSITADVV